MKPNEILTQYHQTQPNSVFDGHFCQTSTGSPFPCNGVTGQTYSGINQINVLQDLAVRGVSEDPYYLTEHQVQSLGGVVVPDATAVPMLVQDGELDTERFYMVWSIHDVQGIDVEQLPAHQAALENPISYVDGGDFEQNLGIARQHLPNPDDPVANAMLQTKMNHQHGVQPSKNSLAEQPSIGELRRAAQEADFAITQTLGETPSLEIPEQEPEPEPEQIPTTPGPRR